jgi:hypothetical protein
VSAELPRRYARVDGTNSIWTVTRRLPDGSYRLENERTWFYADAAFVTLIGSSRAADIDTAVAAGDAQTDAKVRDMHRLVLQLLERGAMSDFDLAAEASRILKRIVKQTSIGKRRQELVTLGLVCDSGRRGISDTGSSCVRWMLTRAGKQASAA